MNAVLDFDSTQGDTIEYSKSGKKKKKGHPKQSKKSTEYHELKSSSGGSKEKEKKLKKSQEKDPLKKEKKSPKGKKEKSTKTLRPVGPSTEIAQKKKKFNTMPTELPSSSTSLKISRTNSEEGKHIKRSSSYAASQEPLGGVLGDLQLQIEAFRAGAIAPQPPPLSPQSRQNLPIKIEVEWNKKIQFLELSIVNLQKLKEMVATSFTLDLEFVSKMCLDVILEYHHNGKFEQLTESNIQNIYQGNGKLRLVVVDNGENVDE